MGKLFGTDGIRGFANSFPMTADIALRTGRALAHYFNEKGGGKVIIGKDTRLSGDVFEHALASGLASMGVDVLLAGVIPTPGVAYLCRTMENIVAGVVISASHNPYHDNGIKVFNGKGFKLGIEEESQLEHAILSETNPELSDKNSLTGRITELPDGLDRYADFLKNLLPGISFKGLKAVVDCSNGAASTIAPRLFTALDLDVNLLSNKPDGVNINAGCGSEHLESLIEKVVETRSDLGLALDGDADRLIAVDQNGTVISGDQLIAVIAKHEKDTSQLANHEVVTTVMSNMGLGSCLAEHGIKHRMAQVGDRNVMIEMLRTGAVVGGEDSGHMIFLNHHTTGDGLISALKILNVIRLTGKPLHQLSRIMTVYPQKLINIEVREKPEINSVFEIHSSIERVEERLKGKGRVLVRYSGTQNMCRVMVEAPTAEETEAFCEEISVAVRASIGAS